jgi:hypothetical protein
LLGRCVFGRGVRDVVVAAGCCWGGRGAGAGLGVAATFEAATGAAEGVGITTTGATGWVEGAAAEATMGALVAGGLAAAPGSYAVPLAAIFVSQIATPPPTTMATMVASMTIPQPTGRVSMADALTRTRALEELES